MDQLLTASLKKGSNCRVDQFVVPSTFLFRRCPNEMVTNEEPIKKCNVTGMWGTYDVDVETACKNLTARHYAVYHWPYSDYLMNEKGFYANIFCALCNMAGFPKHGYCKSGSGDNVHTIPRRKAPPFSVLLGFRGFNPKLSQPVYVSSFTFKNCPDGEWPSPDASILLINVNYIDFF
ncbi:hypothetical protein ElyMa_003289800 [Elysia marginata]|uniref:Uncharacterized protein n=1 Tax=Elysia marginata TaxID=1093978 RepID=A0AAV4JCP8_9GAST|nr:hypothetical protein ElyMa_003289800 [Elysia marginata]